MDKSKGYETFGVTTQVQSQVNTNIDIDKLIKHRLAFMIGEYIVENIDELPIKIEKGVNVKYDIIEYRVKGILISEEKLKDLLNRR